MTMKQRQVAIIHYNTPELTEAAILSLRKHGGEDYHVTVFDNSAPSIDQKTGERYGARPFTDEMPGVTVIDNTKGQVIDETYNEYGTVVGSVTAENIDTLRTCVENAIINQFEIV